MTRFIRQSACHGQRPARAEARRYRPRPARVARLLRDRHRPRLLVAPTGFGKAMLAAEYAETVFGLRHVFWVNGSSPCFLRDLDAEVMEEALSQADAQRALVVFADVPLLDEGRAAALASLAEALVADGCEVIATTTPACESAGMLGRDCVAVDGRALLLDDDEVPETMRAQPEAGRVACLCWADEGTRLLAEGCAQEEMPADVRAVLWAMLVWGRGRRSDVRALLGAERGDEAWDFLAGRYPFLGIDGEEGTFRTAALDTAQVASAFAPVMEAMARAVGCRRRDDMICLLADRAAAGGDSVRGARLVAALATRTGAGAWLGHHGWELVRAGGAAEICRLYDLSARTKLDERLTVNAVVACAHAQLGHRSAALDFCRKVTSATLAPPALKAAAALCAYGQGNASVRERMGTLLEGWLEGLPAEDFGAAAGCDGAAAPQPTGQSAEDSPARGAEEAVLALLVRIALLPRTAPVVARWWQQARPLLAEEEPAVREGCLMAAAWAVDAAAAAGAFEPRRTDAALLASEELAALADWVCQCAREAEEGRCAVGYGAETAVLALERVGEVLATADLPRPGAWAVKTARAARDGRERDAQALTRRAGASSGAGASAGAARLPRSRAFSSPSSAAPAVPLLEVRLFGGVRASLGGRDISAPLLAGRRVRTLLTLLVLHRGCELAREDLVAMLWPRADPATGRKSFYRLWQGLRTVLTVEGACPYLVRDRYGCRLDAALFSSDVAEFEELVRCLLFGGSSLTIGWERVYEQVRMMFSGQLAPSETGNETVDAFRERYAMELVDGLVAASCRLRAAGEFQGALWFARAALERDEMREDAYAALMEAQVAAGQRSSAVATYHACRRYLSDTLGLDPSRRLGALYQRVIEEAPVFG